jgi:hypothetical protein
VLKQEHGAALVVALLAIVLLSALGVVLVSTAVLETRIAANFRNAQEAFYAAEAIVDRAIPDLAAVAEWNSLLNGSVLSTFVDGPPSGVRTSGNGATLDLLEVLNMANCHKTVTCSDADFTAINDDRPWGAANPRWRLFAYGRVADLLPPGKIDSSFYMVAMVGDDPSENDDDPTQDGHDASNPGTGVLALRGESFGASGAHKVVELTVARAPKAVRVLTWREMR